MNPTQVNVRRAASEITAIVKLGFAFNRGEISPDQARKAVRHLSSSATLST